MSDLIERAEMVRRRLRLRQAVVAAALNISQGHYSKVVARRTPLARNLAERLAAWVDVNSTGEHADGDLVTHRMAMLAESIQRQCVELLQLTTRGIHASASPADGEPFQPKTASNLETTRKAADSER
ncbi:hypothetical protein HLH36_07095 [Gluconacetobacter aggeris]|uniref:Uncharacterized protein n=1 Tax=Gluconacetobacter aggeris TaxID=1286186 RepID=A0A7W4NW03_9PROT|nr:hypothetical protein [Gluconacetobacter aggeris]MBB2168119.1 hypothetical protein [Gluconacetobacter aggeris]